MFLSFEVRIWETDEDLGELCTPEEVDEEFHCVGSDGGNVLVASRDGGGGCGGWRGRLRCNGWRRGC